MRAVFTSRRSSKTVELARNGRKRVNPFSLDHCRSEGYWACLSDPFESPAGEGQRVSCKPPGNLELGIVKEGRTWRPIPLWANLLQRPAEPLHERIRTGPHHYFPIQFLSRSRKVTGSRKVAKGFTALADELCFTPKPTTAFSFWVGRGNTSITFRTHTHWPR